MTFKTSLLSIPIVRSIYQNLNNQYVRDAFVKSQLTGLKFGSIILDAGCGSQRYRQDCSHLNYRSQDFGQYSNDSKESLGTDLLGGSEGYTYGQIDYLGDIWQIEERDKTFDAILCTEVFEHLSEPQRALRELARVLKPGGCILLTAPFRALYHQDPYFYFSGFSRYWYQHHAAACGLVIERIEPNGGYLGDVAQELVRIVRMGPLWQRLCSAVLTLPLLAYLALLQRWGRFRTPESCWGYHVWLIKPS